MLTRAGWSTGAGAVGLAVFGRIFGILELYLLAAAAGGLVVLSLFAVYTLRPRLGVERTLHPPRVHAGGASRVDLQLTNEGRRRTPVLGLRDSVSGTRGANLMLSPLRQRDTVRAAYQLPTDRRGVLHIGPLDIEVGDPFGLVRRRSRAAGRADLVVYPRVERLVPLPMTSGVDPQRGADNPHALGRSGEDFYAIRDYVVGDDLRRVHWPSTARHDELMIRQDELPRFGSTTVLIDTRRSAHTPESFELVISAAASILSASQDRGDRIRLVTTDGFDSDEGSGAVHLDTILHRLALATLTEDASLTTAMSQIARHGKGGTLVLILALASPITVNTAIDHRAGWGSALRVVFEPSAWDPARTRAEAGFDGPALRVTGDRPFATVWNEHSSTARGVSGRTRGFQPSRGSAERRNSDV